MKFLILPVTFLVLFWLALSGHYTGLLLTLGAVSCIWAALITRRMEIVDHEGYPIHLVPWRIITYWFWLSKEILVSTWAVSKMILAPEPKLHPKVALLPADEMSEMQQVIYANSITLTPGTLTLEVDDSGLEIHALRSEMLEMLERGDMANRVRPLESQKGSKST